MSAPERPPAGPESPGWQDGVAQVAAPEPYRSLGGLARWIVGLILVLLASYAVSVVLALAVYGLGEYSTPARFDRYSGGEVAIAVLGFVQGLLYIAGAVLFIIWLYRAYRNLSPLGASPRRRPGWAIGAWFVPILNLILPKLMANEVWRAGEPGGREHSGGRAPIPLFHHVWWASWVIGLVVGIGVGVQSGVSAGLGEATSASGAVTVALTLLSAVTAVLAAVVVRRSSRRQDSRWGEATAWTAG